jgi:hypothetical protein
MKEYYIDTNEILSEIIEEVTNFEENKTFSDKNNRYFSERSFYVAKNVDKINHLLSETFYTQEYVSQVIGLLGDSEGFLSLSDYDRKLVQSELDMLSHDDYALKTYLQKSVREGKNLHKLPPASFNKFKRN